MGGGVERDVRTVSFLFADVEGSTRLLQDLGAAYADTIDLCRSTFRAAIAASEGRELGTEGDSFFVVFENASDALQCAARAQLELKTVTWPTARRALVRIGIHSGEAEQRDADRFVGLAVHQAARVCSAANGGQTLLTDATRALAMDSLPEGCSLDDLGMHRFKDLDRPLRLFELVHPAFEPSRPPRTLDVRLHNLPVQATPFTGRYDELQEIEKLLREGRVRSLTLTGPGGIGKTRLSLQAAAASIDSFPDGVWFVPLAAIVDADRVASAVAQAIGVSESHEQSPATAVIEDLRDKKALLVLDNVEHVLGCRDFVADVLTQAPRVCVLATSREPLRIAAEQLYPVPSMHMPPDDPSVESAAHADAVELFVDRLRASDPHFVLDESNVAAVTAICRRLDGLPLAIELAAARAAAIGPIALAERLQNDLRVLGGGPDDAPERHRTLEAAVAWSYDSLDERLRTILGRLSVFAARFGEEPARSIADASIDDLLALTERSLLRRDPESDAPRFEMLTTIRDVARRKLEAAGELDATLERHTAYFCALANQLWTRLHGPEAVAWLRRLDEGQHDIRAVIERLPDARAADLTAEMAEFWATRGYFEEARERLRAAVDACPVGTIERAHAVVALSRLTHNTALRIGDRALAPELLQAITTSHAAGDRSTEARALVEIAPHVHASGLEDVFGSAVEGVDPRDHIAAVLREAGLRGKKQRRSAREVLAHALVIADEIGDGALAGSIRTNPLYQHGFRGFLAASLGTKSVVDPALRSATTRGDRAAQADLLMRRSTGPIREREANAERALELATELGDATLMMRALARLTDTARRRKDFAAAVDRGHRALALQEGELDETGRNLLFILGSVASELGDLRALRRLADVSAACGGHRIAISYLTPWALAARFRGAGTAAAGVIWMLAFPVAASTWRAAILGAAGYFFTQVLDSLSDRPALWRRVSMHDASAIFLPGIAFVLGLVFHSASLGGVLVFVFVGGLSSGGVLRGNVFGATAKPVSFVLAVAGIVAVLVAGGGSPVPPVIALVLAAHAALRSADERSAPDAAWAILRAASAVARASSCFVAADLLARWRTAGAMDFASWHRVAFPVVAVGLGVCGLVVAISDRELRSAGIALLVSAPALAVAFGGWGSRPALAGGLVFGLAWVVVGVGRMRVSRPSVPEIYPERELADRSVRGGRQALA